MSSDSSAGMRSAPTTVEEFVRRALPHINENLNWGVIKRRFDPDPVGKALGFVLYEEDDAGTEHVEEAFGLRITDGPRADLVPYEIEAATDPQTALGMGDILTYRQTAINVLHPDHELDPQTAHFQRGEVAMRAAEPLQKRRVWLVGSVIMDMVTEELDHILPRTED